MLPPQNASGMEPQISKGTNPTVERWHQANALLQEAQLYFARGDRRAAAELLRDAADICPDHAQVAQILNQEVIVMTGQ